VSATFQTTLVALLAASAHTAELKHRYSRKERKFADEEQIRRQARKDAKTQWLSRSRLDAAAEAAEDAEKQELDGHEYTPTEGGRDAMKRDVQYYARRCGLECETIDVVTSDGFILDLWHIYDPAQPRETKPINDKKRYPILMIHGLLQSSGAYTCTDEHSFAFHFAKAGYDVWLGNNRCGFHPRHERYKHSDPRMWAWNIKEMATLDLPALVDRVLALTDSPKLALIGHSQGTSQILVALHKDFVPDLGSKISVACLLAPAAYSGPILNSPRWFFKVMIRMPPKIWRICFGRHAFLNPLLPLMNHVPMKAVSAVGYPLFHYLFQWSDRNWDAGLRQRSFMWAPTYVSSEHMRWWVGRDGFVKQQCILSSREEADAEAADDAVFAAYEQASSISGETAPSEKISMEHKEALARAPNKPWFDDRAPPLAMWVAECDELVDGPRLLRRFQNGREPHARVAHAEVVEDYEHLDVIWAVDAIERVGKNVMNVIWATMDETTRDQYLTPRGVGLKDV
jgi:pimeloyl-ACP methyl ester carboxylesterase